MTFKCLECGHIFEEGEEYRWTEMHGEVWCGCPICRGEFDITESCVCCGGQYTSEDLYDGWCEECLEDAVNYDNFLEYLMEDDGKYNKLIQFSFLRMLDSSVPESVSAKLIELMREWYLKKKADDLICGSKEFITICKAYVLVEGGSEGKADYAEWLNRRKDD